jgi:hypothetical protein
MCFVKKKPAFRFIYNVHNVSRKTSQIFSENFNSNLEQKSVCRGTIR